MVISGGKRERQREQNTSALPARNALREWRPFSHIKTCHVGVFERFLRFYILTPPVPFWHRAELFDLPAPPGKQRHRKTTMMPAVLLVVIFGCLTAYQA